VCFKIVQMRDATGKYPNNKVDFTKITMAKEGPMYRFLSRK